MHTIEELRNRVDAGEVDTVVVAFTDHYGRNLGKRFDAQFFIEEVAGSGTHGCDYLLTTDMEMNPVAGYAFASWETGYGDFHLVPDLDTMRSADWLDRSAIVLCNVSSNVTHEAVEEAPRTLLRKQVDRAQGMGFTVEAASELEYFMFRDTYEAAAASSHSGLNPAGWYLEDYHLLPGARVEDFNAAARRHLRESRIPVESTKGEWGRGQHELNVRYAEVMEMADRHVILKQCLKELADRQEMSVTFMAKPFAEQAGSSCHTHLSLWDGDRNAFDGSDTLGPVQCSDTFRWFLGGWMAHARELMVFCASNINSYKRFLSGSWAPTHVAWSRDNRTAGFRIVGDGQSLRIESRLAGADCNPYLVYAAALASGLDGIEQKIEPPAMFAGDAYQAGGEVPQVPATLRDAIRLFAESAFSRKAFGDAVVDHYIHFFRTEQQQFDEAVTDWERRRYFERI